MEMLPEIVRRRALRSLSSRPIPDDAAERMLGAAMLAPSCFNNQPWRFVAVSDSEQLAKVKESLTEGNAWARESPLIILAFTKPSLDCRQDEGRDYALFDLGLAAMNLVIQAEHEGIVAHPIAGFNPKKAKAACGVGSDFVLVSLVVCGYLGENPHLSEWQLEREKGPGSGRIPPNSASGTASRKSPNPAAHCTVPSDSLVSTYDYVRRTQPGVGT